MNQKNRLEISTALLSWHKRKSFLHKIGDEKWVIYDNPKRCKSWINRGTDFNGKFALQKSFAVYMVAFPRNHPL